MKLLVSPDLKQLIHQHAPNECFGNKCLLFCSVLLMKSTENKEQYLDEHDYFPLMARINEALYTRRAYYEMRLLLEEMDAIEIRGEKLGQKIAGQKSYLSSAVTKRLKAEKKCDVEPYSKGYRLAVRFRNAVEVEIDDPRLEQRYEDRMATASYAAMSGDARKWIIHSYKQVSFSSAAAGILAGLDFGDENSRLVAYHHFRNVLGKKPRFMPKDSGRIYYSIPSLRREVRPEIMLAGEQTVELDIATCQPALLSTLYDPILHGTERAKYLELLEAGLYEQIAAWGGEGWTRAESKQQFFNQIAFGSHWCRANYPLLAVFEGQFPILGRLMDDVKRGGNAVLPLRMQRLEAEIVIYGAIAELSTMQILCLPVHDALIVRQVDGLRAAEVLARHWELKTGIPARIKGLPDDLAA